MKLTVLATVILLAGCSLLNSPPSHAGTIVVTWTNPTTNTDNTPIPINQGTPESLQTWRIEYGTCSAPNVFGVKAGEFVRTRAVDGPELTTATNNVPAGMTCARVYVSNFAGNESTPSNVASRLVPAATPRNPTNTAAS